LPWLQKEFCPKEVLATVLAKEVCALSGAGWLMKESRKTSRELDLGEAGRVGILTGDVGLSTPALVDLKEALIPAFGLESAVDLKAFKAEGEGERERGRSKSAVVERDCVPSGTVWRP
jgi:hypothetical protein